jgi:hypothetical protein
MLADDCAVAVIGNVEIVGHEPIMTVSGRTVSGRGSSDDDLSMNSELFGEAVGAKSVAEEGSCTVPAGKVGADVLPWVDGANDNGGSLVNDVGLSVAVPAAEINEELQHISSSVLTDVRVEAVVQEVIVGTGSLDRGGGVVLPRTVPVEVGVVSVVLEAVAVLLGEGRRVDSMVTQLAPPWDGDFVRFLRHEGVP